jgi:hypothetical protein
VEEPPWWGPTWGAEAPPPRCLLEQGIEEKIYVDGEVRVGWSYFFSFQNRRWSTDGNQGGHTAHSLYEHRGNDAKLQKKG